MDALVSDHALYEADFSTWCDLDNVAAEIAALGRSQADGLQSAFADAEVMDPITWAGDAPRP